MFDVERIALTHHRQPCLPGLAPSATRGTAGRGASCRWDPVPRIRRDGLIALTMLPGVAVAPGLACVALLAPLAVKILAGAAGGRLNWGGYRLARPQRRRVPALSAAAVARRR